MNKTFKLISLGLLTTVALSTTNVSADCIGSGFGVGVTLSATQQRITFNDKNIKKAHEQARGGLKDKLKAAIAATQSKFSKPNSKDTKIVEDGGVYKIDAYSEGGTAGTIAGGSGDWTNATELSDKKTTLEFKTKKFDSENPTKYKIVDLSEGNKDTDKYDKNGLKDDAKGAYIGKVIIPVYPNLLKDSKFQVQQGEKTDYDTTSTDTTKTANYFKLEKLQNDGKTVETTYYITPRDQDFLSEIDLDESEFADEKNWPTHALLSDVFANNANDKITKAFFTDINNNDTLKSEYRKQFEGDEWFTYNNNTYINTVKHKDLGITDAIRDNAISTLAPSKALSNEFKDVSKWSFDLGFNIFYQHRIFDWFIRAGIFGNFPIANRTISLVANSNNNNNKDSKDKKSSNNDLSLTHSFDIGIQVLFGYNVTQTFALVFGGEVGYSKYILNNLNQLSSGYNMDSDKLVEWLAAGSSKEEVLKDYNNTFKNYGLSDKEKSFNKWFWRFVAGCEFNFGKCIVGLHGFFGPNTTLMNSKNNKDFGDLKVVNGGVRASIAFKF